MRVLCGCLLHCKVFLKLLARLGLVLSCVRPVRAGVFRWPLWFPRAESHSFLRTFYVHDSRGVAQLPG